MWIVNCILLIIGSVAAVMGVSFIWRNKEAAGNIRFYIFSIGVFSALWCISYGMIGITDQLSLCDPIRKFGVFAICAFLTTEAFLVAEMSGARSGFVKAGKIAAVVISLIDFLVYSKTGVDIFSRENGVTTWVANSEFALNRKIHSLYILLIFLILISFGIVWIITNKVKRLQHFLALVFISNFIMLFFTLPDTFLPAMGYKAISTSGIGAAACAIVMWYGATQLSSFDIRMGSIKDRTFDFIEAGVVVFDLNHKAALVNRYVRKRNGESGQGLPDFFRIDEKRVKEIFEQSEDRIYTVRLWDKNNRNAYSVRIGAAKDNYRETFCYICVFVDVTEEVKAISKFEIASEAKSRFLAQMSHEIRTPINAVLGMNEMILREAQDQDILEYSQNIDSAGNTLLTLINSILDFSKIEDGKMDIIPVRYDTASFINDLVNSISQRAEAKELLFEVDVDEQLPCALIGDDVRVAQVIMNLLTNAVKYTDKGSVKLSVRSLEKNAGKIKLYVSVRDTGIGIKDEDRQKLFESFERLDEVRNHNIEGTGLGISIVTSLLAMMGSSLKVESVYGEGSVFSFVLEQEIDDETPIGNLEQRLKETTRERKKVELITAPKARVLVVDDNAMNLKVAMNLMKLCGIKADTAPSGEKTIECMKTKSYDIVFLDHMMPKMDGIETLGRLREENLIPEETVMIALTANAVVGAKEGYLSAGFTDYLSKPIELKALVNTLKTYLPETAYEREETEEQPSGTDSKKGVYDLKALKESGLDVDTGVDFCASDEELYYEVLDDFTAFCGEKLKEIDEFYNEESWHEYEVTVHALKSNLKVSGADSGFKLARAMEKAAEDLNIDYIRENHEKLMDLISDIAAMIISAKR